MVRQLVELKADVNAQDDMGYTPLMQALVRRLNLSVPVCLHVCV